MKHIIFIFFFIQTFVLIAQQLDNVGKQGMVRINGGINTSQILYTSEGIQARRTPYTYVYNGNLALDFLGMNTQVMFTYANPTFSRQFSHPFNRLSLHPTYKWIKGHIGQISMSFSPYTLNGHLFTGAGIELEPSKIGLRFSALYGEFLKPIVRDTLLNPLSVSSYKRMGAGVKLGYGKNQNRIDLSYFRAKDKENSLTLLMPEERLSPQENVAYGISITKSLVKNLVLTGELGFSALTQDQRALNSDRLHVFQFGGLQVKENTRLYKAMKGNLTYVFKGASIGIGYERIDPEYKTFGAYYFTNDLENITVQLGKQFLNGKIGFMSNVGLQHDNLDGNKSGTMKRVVGSLSLNYTPSARLNFTGSYSNFQSYTNVRPVFDQVNALNSYELADTLNFRQVSENMAIGSSYVLSQNKNRRQMLMFNLMYQKTADFQQTHSTSLSDFYNLNTTYSLSFVPQQLTTSLTLNGNKNDNSLSHTKTWGPTLSCSKGLFNKKVKATASFSYNTSELNQKKQSEIYITRVGFGYVLAKKHNLNLNAVMLNNQRHLKENSNYKEYTLTATYSYNFSVYEYKPKTSN